MPGGRRVFREFLRCEYSEENILFWLACEDLKKENNPEKIEEKARMIYEDYVSILSPREVSWEIFKNVNIYKKKKRKKEKKWISLVYKKDNILEKKA